MKRSFSSLVLGMLFLSVLSLCGCQDNRQRDLSENLKYVAKLATLECVCHSTGSIAEPVFVIENVGAFGDQKYWAEYDVTFKLGIDASKLVVHEPEGDKVVVEIPKAGLIEDPQIVGTSVKTYEMSVYIPQDHKDSVERKATDDVRDQVQHDEALLNAATERAKMLIEENVVNTGKVLGTNYRVEFVDI